MNILQDVQHLLAFPLTPIQVVGNMGTALGCGLLVSCFYRWVTRRPSNGRTFAGTLVVLTMITGLVIMVIGNNLARAFGLVGAMSIVRFRTAVKDVRDIAFIFFSLAAGMASGIGVAAIAFTSTICIGLVAVAVFRTQGRAENRREYLLQFSYTPLADGEAPYVPLLARYCRQHHLINTKTHDIGDQLEMSFYVLLRDQSQRDEFVLALGRLDGIQRINLFFDEEYE